MRQARVEDRAIPLSHIPIYTGAPVKRLIALGCAVTLCFCAICGYVLMDMGNRDYEQARSESVNLVAALSSEVARKIELIDLSLQGVGDGLKIPGLIEAGPTMRKAILFDRSATSQDMGSVFVINREGEVRFESQSDVPRAENFSKYDFFTHHLNQAGHDTYVSLPWVTKRGVWVVGISRRLDDAKGNFDGVVIATLQLSYFYDLFKVLAVAPGDNLTLFRTQGTVLMRWPFDASFVGRDLSGIELFKRFKTRRIDSYELNFYTDGVRRLAAYHQAGNAPLVVTFGRSVQSIFAEGKRKAWLIGLTVFAVCAFNMGLVVFLARSLKLRSKAEHELAIMAATDSLTGLCNRRRFDEIFEAEWRRAQRDRNSVALLLIDADNFKSYNDQFGHQAGDAMLAVIARAIGGSTRRPADIAARWGGEEFAVLLPGTLVKDAFDLAERIRANVLALAPGPHGWPDSAPTVSIGVAAMIPRAGLAPADLVKTADDALYEAKAAGRNRSVKAVPHLVGQDTRAA
jgi:diguanylate cyclase (GGDEF)-like protein